MIRSTKTSGGYVQDLIIFHIIANQFQNLPIRISDRERQILFQNCCQNIK